MFAVEHYPNEGRPWPLQFTAPSWKGSKWVVDHERGLYFVVLYRRTRSEDMFCLLGDGRIAIPLETEYVFWDSFNDPRTGEPYHLTRFRFRDRKLPASEHRNPKYQGWFLPHPFADDAVKDHWLRIAAEAILAHRWAGTGLEDQDGGHRVELNGEHLRLSDFGYTPNRPQPLIGPAPQPTQKPTEDGAT